MNRKRRDSRGRKLPLKKVRIARAKAGWRGLVRSKFSGDERAAKEYMRQFAYYWGDAMYEGTSISLGHERPNIDTFYEEWAESNPHLSNTDPNMDVSF